jgi:hypothetical protein
VNKPLYVDLPQSLYEAVREYAHLNKLSKRDVVLKALMAYMDKPQLPPDERLAEKPVKVEKKSIMDRIIERKKKDNMPFEL